MSPWQVVAKVEWPLALPLVISGLRSATLQVVATATVAAYSSGEGLGRLLITGNATRNYSQMFAGAFLVAVLAIVLDILLGGLGWLASRHASPGRGSRTDRGRSPGAEITGESIETRLNLVG
jgi:osmoprotectant transport system permease protein